jgi:hypothetical protein
MLKLIFSQDKTIKKFIYRWILDGLASTSFLCCMVEALRRGKPYNFCHGNFKNSELSFRMEIKSCLRSFDEKLSL